MRDDRPLFSRCSLGNGRWFWIVFPPLPELFDGKPALATGYATSHEDAQAQALRAAPGARPWAAGWASEGHRKVCADKRRARPPSKSTGTRVKEYVYCHGWSEFHGGSIRHEVIKTTKRYVYVTRRPVGWADHEDPFLRQTFALNRAELEAEGSAWSHSARQRFYTRPPDEEPPDLRRAWGAGRADLEALGLTADATPDDVEYAYRRLCLKHHPDRGGSAEEFKRVQAAYERLAPK
jgi:hypothetical protein